MRVALFFLLPLLTVGVQAVEKKKLEVVQATTFSLPIASPSEEKPKTEIQIPTNAPLIESAPMLIDIPSITEMLIANAQVSSYEILEPLVLKVQQSGKAEAIHAAIQALTTTDYPEAAAQLLCAVASSISQEYAYSICVALFQSNECSRVVPLCEAVIGKASVATVAIMIDCIIRKVFEIPMQIPLTEVETKEGKWWENYHFRGGSQGWCLLKRIEECAKAKKDTTPYRKALQQLVIEWLQNEEE